MQQMIRDIGGKYDLPVKDVEILSEDEMILEEPVVYVDSLEVLAYKDSLDSIAADSLENIVDNDDVFANQAQCRRISPENIPVIQVDLYDEPPAMVSDEENGCIPDKKWIKSLSKSLDELFYDAEDTVESCKEKLLNLTVSADRPSLKSFLYFLYYSCNLSLLPPPPPLPPNAMYKAHSLMAMSLLGLTP